MIDSDSDITESDSDMPDDIIEAEERPVRNLNPERHKFQNLFDLM